MVLLSGRGNLTTKINPLKKWSTIEILIDLLGN